MSDQQGGSDAAGDGPRARIAWRLLAANNRALGRSAHAYGSVAECVAAASRLHQWVLDTGTGLEAVTVSVTDSSWHWVLEGADPLDCLEGEGGRSSRSSLAASVHRYQRRLECLRGAGQFLVAVASTSPALDAAGATASLRRIGPRPFVVYGGSGMSRGRS
ncbi:hypothetical protein M6D93_00030 [Jatrophihabitans telluris]|uniref:SAVED domain-containing protein n=1 Tax=Jatrophihabitans telluris TaxID=2038343 RepID=A0ABY4QYB7_9ACTN|nr:hypothetical protein [Jatrophihabitans telluris]UQX88409.1 hypothetical protein M6D93_00030 [Jatrophihabitans telluris]